MARAAQIKNPMLERQQVAMRVLVAALGIAVLTGVLGWRLISLQVIHHADYATRSDDNRMRPRIVAPARGLIFDRNGVVLAENLPTYQLEIVPEQVESLENTVTALAELIDIPDRDRERFYERVDQGPRFASYALRTRLTTEEVARFEVNRQKFHGVEIRAALTRRYPLGADAAHLVGYVGSINQSDMERLDPRRYRSTRRIGKVGAEAAHESLLHGEPGSKIIETNAQGRSLRDLDYQRPTAGQDIYLTIDAATQIAATRALGQHNGAIAAIAPQTGEVLALVKGREWDRAQETEADVLGTTAMVRAGLDARQLAEFFRILEEKQGEVPDVLGWLMTHPNHATRVQEIEAQVDATEGVSPAPLDLDWDDVLRRIDAEDG